MNVWQPYDSTIQQVQMQMFQIQFAAYELKIIFLIVFDQF